MRYILAMLFGLFCGQLSAEPYLQMDVVIPTGYTADAFTLSSPIKTEDISGTLRLFGWLNLYRNIAAKHAGNERVDACEYEYTISSGSQTTYIATNPGHSMTWYLRNMLAIKLRESVIVDSVETNSIACSHNGSQFLQGSGVADG